MAQLKARQLEMGPMIRQRVLACGLISLVPGELIAADTGGDMRVPLRRPGGPETPARLRARLGEERYFGLEDNQ